MNKIHEIAGDGALMPRSGDGMVNMAEPIRVMAESPVDEAMGAQADEACKAGNQRNGYRERGLATSVGAIDLRIPKPPAGSHFPEDLIGRCSRAGRAVIAAVSEMAADGASTRKVKRAERSMGMGRMGSGQVSRMRSSLDDAVADPRERDLPDVKYPYVRLDAAYIKRGGDGRVQPTALATAICAGSGGYRRLLGLDAIDTESYDGWKSFLLSLRARGVSGAICVTGDAHEGLKRAIQEVLPGAAWQRCIVHLMRDAAGNAAARRKRGAVLGILKAVFAERDPGLVRELHHLAIEQIDGFCPKAAELLEDAEADAPAHPDLPCGHHAGLRADDVQERANREPRHRSRVVQVFPSRKSPIGMMGAVFAEMDGEWAARRRLDDESMGRAVEGAKVNAPAPAYEGAATGHAARIIALVAADNPVPGRKAA